MPLAQQMNPFPPSAASTYAGRGLTVLSRTTTATTWDSRYGGASADDVPVDDLKEKDMELLSPSTASSSLPAPDADEWFARFHSDADLPAGVGDECPDRATLTAAYDIPIYNADGQRMPFGSIYDPAYSLHQRQLVIFIRHFYCGACQAYLQALARSITRDDYFSIPTPTSIIVIGCGHPHMIKHYRKFTECPFPIYADPTRRLFKRLGLSVTLNVGAHRPDYMKDISVPAWAAGQIKTVHRSLKDPDGISTRDVFRAGNLMQTGGEFLFDDGDAVWCHRMRSYRDHTEVNDIRKLLELDD